MPEKKMINQTGTLVELNYLGYTGLDNINDPVIVGGDGLVRARNIDLDDRGKPSLRLGRTLVDSGEYRSLWSDGKTCLAVKNGHLVLIGLDLSNTVIRPNVGTARMSYTSVNNEVYYTNNSVIGYVKDNLNFNISATTKDFRIPLPPGRFIEYYRGRMYLAKGSVILYSDALAFQRVDMRRNFMQLKSDITMLRAVDDGIYVSDNEATYFISGLSPKKAQLVRVFDFPAVIGSDVRIPASWIKSDLKGNAAVWLGRDGICYGFSGGEAVNVTDKKYVVPACNTAAGIAFNRKFKKQYIVTLQ